MKLSLPTHVPVRSILPAIAIVMAIQVVEGSNLLTAMEFAAFVLVSADAFNAVGGMAYPSGSYIFFLATLSVGLGGLGKTLLGEPLDSNLYNGQQTMLVYLVGMCAVWVAAKLTARIRAKRAWLARFQIDHRAPQIALGSAIFAQFGGNVVPGSVLSTFNQINNFLPLAILVCAYTRTKETGGKTSFTFLGFAIWTWATIGWGILQFTKQGMFLPSAIWAIGALIAGYETTVKKLAIIVAGAILALTFLTPVSQIGRNFRYQEDSSVVAWDLLSHPLETRRQYQEAQLQIDQSGSTYHWYSSGQGLLDRLAMVPVDDALIHVTDQGHQRGPLPIIARFQNAVPRYLLSGDKVTYHWGNSFAHEIGLLAKHDDITGVSFTPFADAYHCLGWWGLLIIFPLCLLMFVVCDSLTGDTSQTIWAALYISLFAHSAPEGMLNTPFSAVTTYAFGVCLAAVLCRIFLPYIGGFLLPPQRAPFESLVIPRRPVPLAASPSTVARTIEGSL